jgi:hypothetical protein
MVKVLPINKMSQPLEIESIIQAYINKGYRLEFMTESFMVFMLAKDKAKKNEANKS